jgi:hypothetical protein
MSIPFLPKYNYLNQQFPLFNENIKLFLSKQRIIQKNLVHLLGFPDSMYNENLLLSPEYLGQYGSITKISLVSKEDKGTNQKINSAYITFETSLQAAYCILTIDSIKLNNQTVRAFFGTTKYCIHFINNYRCFNQDKCMFLHQIADPSDIIDENTKFGYNEHINLAKKIVGYGTIQSKYYVLKNNYSRTKTVLPSIKTIYDKDDIHITKIIHKRNSSNLSNSSTSNNSFNISNNRHSSESSSKEEEKSELNKDAVNKKNLENNKNIDLNDDTSFELFKSGKKSRFFNYIYSECDSYNSYESESLIYIVNNICERMSLFNYFKKFNEKFIKELEINFCYQLYKKTNDNEIKLLLENKF